jgi:menaquinone-dependent protoporphyrinogen oxidase
MNEMTVLIAAASKHGATGEIAARIGTRLVERGIDIELKDIDNVGELSRYDAFVIGSGIYLGNWMKEGRRFLDAHAAELAERPTWLFASGSIVGDPPVADDPDALRTGLTNRLVELTHARQHKLFAGKLDSSTLGLLEKAAVRGAHASKGDHRGWQAIDEWAEAIAHELEQHPVGSGAAYEERRDARDAKNDYPSASSLSRCGRKNATIRLRALRADGSW